MLQINDSSNISFFGYMVYLREKKKTWRRKVARIDLNFESYYEKKNEIKLNFLLT